MDSERLRNVIRSWENTPYKRAVSEKDYGASCLGFVFGVLKDFFNDTEPFPPLSYNDQKQLVQILKHAKTRWGYEEVAFVSVSALLPMDVLLSVSNSLHHVLILENIPRAWHTTPSGGVCPCSVFDYIPRRVFRCPTI
jgi:hypothetical protein